MVESGVTTREKYCQVLPVFFFVNEHNNANTKPQTKKERFFQLSQKFPEEKQQPVEEKGADNIRKVLCKSFIQWFRELNVLLWVPSRLFWFATVILWLLLKWKSRNTTKHLMSGPSGNQLVLFFPLSPDVMHQDSRENKTNCFPRDLTLRA